MTLSQITNFVKITKEIATSGQPSQQQFQTIRDCGYRAVINLAMPDSDNAIAEEGNTVTALGMSYFHIPVPFDAPTPESLKLFIDLMQALSGKKVWVHCALNYRVSAFMYQYQRLVLGVTSDMAKSPVFKVWQPDAVWQHFMALSAEEIGL